MTDRRRNPSREAGKPSRMPENSVFYARVIPLLLAGLGLLMVVLILFAAGVLLGWVKF